MTGWIGEGPVFISDVTRGSLRDLGYNVELINVPEPEPAMLLFGGLAMMIGCA
jgi:hypothetical protein